MTEKTKPLKKLSTTPLDTKTTKPVCGNVYPRLLKSAAVPTTQGQRYTETNNSQTPVKKYNKIGK